MSITYELNASWEQANNYNAPIKIIHVSWSDGQYVTPVGFYTESIGQSTVRQKEKLLPLSIDYQQFGSVKARTDKQYTEPQYRLDAYWLGRLPYTPPTGLVNPTWKTGIRFISPIGFDSLEFGDTVLEWTEFIAPIGIDSLNVGNGYALYDYQYPYPEWILDASWSGSDKYLTSTGSLSVGWSVLTTTLYPVGFDSQEFGSKSLSWTQYVSCIGGETLRIGRIFTTYSYEYAIPSVVIDASWSGKLTYQVKKHLVNGQWAKDTGDKTVSIIGYDYAEVGIPFVEGMRGIVYPNGIAPEVIEKHNVENKARPIVVKGANYNVFGSTKLEVLRTYLRPTGVDGSKYGQAYVSGGVKSIRLNGADYSKFGTTTVINTTANRYISLNKNGIPPIEIPKPDVSPKVLFPFGINSAKFGQLLLQKNPSPKGFDNAFYGVAWVSESPRYLKHNSIDSFLSGYPKVFDPRQSIYITTVIAGGVFGDISLRNTRRIINLSGLYAQSFGDWGIIESTRRFIEIKGFDSKDFGTTNIYNKTPSIAPIGISSFAGLNAAIGYRIRTLKPSGFYQPKLGNHRLTKTPELKPSGLNQSTFGYTWISNKTRSIYAGLGRESLAIGESKIWHYSRSIRTSGLEFSKYGAASIEHGRRTILAKGSAHATYGNNSWVSYAVRSLSPSSIAYPNIPNHRVGGTQRINVFGYVATLFGSRIIPESQSIYPKGFINTFGISAIDLWKKYIKPNSFLTTGQEGGHRFGTHKFWNLRQYIEMYYDVDSGLTPPKWAGWTTVANKNRVIGAIGTNVAKVAEPSVTNNARLIALNGISGTQFSQHMIAARVRYFRLQGIEQPYISGWSNIYNSAFVIAPTEINTQYFGTANIVNTRRYFNRIGNFESLAMGVPMIAPRIRNLLFEHRYTIAPIYLPLPKVDLYTRYVEEVGRFDDHQIFGTPSLSVHFNKVITRWSHRDLFGEPKLHNVTPELKQRGHNSEEFGNIFTRLQWRDLLQQGSETVLFGRVVIAFKDRQFAVSGFNALSIGDKLKVIKTGAPPYSLQYIWLNGQIDVESEETSSGNGIGIPSNQVPKPFFKNQGLSVDGFDALKIGDSHHLQSNGILLDSGVPMPSFDQGPIVILQNRNIAVEKGINSPIVVGSPRLSPHTIYAVKEAPTQATQNHTATNLHYVNSSVGTRSPGEVFGRVRLTLQHRVIRDVGIGNVSRHGGVNLQLRKRYVEVKGIQSFRMGWISIGDGKQFITQYSSTAMSRFGVVQVSQVEQLHRAISLKGFASQGISNLTWISHYDRALNMQGFDALRVGTRKSGDKPFMWQGLRVGELVQGNYGGYENEIFGQAWISLKVRGLAPKGFDAFAMEYDYTQFDKRMRVTQSIELIPNVDAKPVGFDTLYFGVPNIKPATHYIRPDGNADNYRKGAF